MKFAEIHDVGFAVRATTAHTEAELAAEILSMDLRREIEGWHVNEGFAIAVRNVRRHTSGHPLLVSDLIIKRFSYDMTAKEIDEEKHHPDLPSVPVPDSKYLIADTVTMRTRKDGLLVRLIGWNQVSKDVMPDGSYTTITESAESTITAENLPVIIGLVATEKLLNIQPVVFKPEGVS